jgi:hypothetical protein
MKGETLQMIVWRADAQQGGVRLLPHRNFFLPVGVLLCLWYPLGDEPKASRESLL